MKTLDKEIVTEIEELRWYIYPPFILFNPFTTRTRPLLLSLITPTSQHKCRERHKKKRKRKRGTYLPLPSPLLQPLLLLLLPLPIQILLLLIRTHTPKQPLPLLLLQPFSRNLPLFSLLFVIRTLQLLDLVFADGTDFAKDFGAEVGAGSELVGETEERGEDWEGGVVGVCACGGGEKE